MNGQVRIDKLSELARQRPADAGLFIQNPPRRAPGIGQHEFQQVRCLLGAENRPGKALRHQLGQQPAVIDMGMGQHDGIHFTGFDR